MLWFPADDLNNTPSTLEEPVTDTLYRDFRRIVSNTSRVIGFQRGQRTPEERAAILREWDLYGPSFFVLTLSLTLSHCASKDDDDDDDDDKYRALVFAVVFTILTVGAGAVTLNAQLLGGKLGFFQTCSLVGYSIAPLVLASFLCLFRVGGLIRILVAIGCVAWSIWSASPVVGVAVPVERRLLALYPLMLLFLTVGWLLIVLK